MSDGHVCYDIMICQDGVTRAVPIISGSKVDPSIKIMEEQRRKENSETTKIQKEATEQRRKEQEDKSVYVKGFRMPFGEMVTFIFKWTMASIPTAIFLAILFLIFTAIFA